jgi:predicted outer membrane protein
MKSRTPLFALCVVLASPVFAVEKKNRTKSGSTLPPTSPILMISEGGGNTIETMDADGLITTKLGGRDLDFFESLLETGQLQVLLGELVKTRAESPLVKSVGTILASTQTEENKQINRLASLNGLTLSAAAQGVQRQTSAELEKLSGSSFDIACVSKIIEANKETVRAYEEGAESKNPEIQNFSQQMLPIARERLRIAGKMIEAPVKPATGVATPSPKTPLLQLRPPAPSPETHRATPPPQAVSGTPAPLSATPAPLTLGAPQPVPFPAQQPGLPTPPPLTGGAPIPDSQLTKEGAPASDTPAPAKRP